MDCGEIRSILVHMIFYKFVRSSDFYIRGLLFWSLETLLSSLPESDDSVLVSTPRCREELEEMKSSDGSRMYGCGSAKRMTDWTLLEMPIVTPMFMAPPSARL
jgi:hypothetical protein